MKEYNPHIPYQMIDRLKYSLPLHLFLKTLEEKPWGFSILPHWSDYEITFRCARAEPHSVCEQAGIILPVKEIEVRCRHPKEWRYILTEKEMNDLLEYMFGESR